MQETETYGKKMVSVFLQHNKIKKTPNTNMQIVSWKLCIYFQVARGTPGIARLCLSNYARGVHNQSV